MLFRSRGGIRCDEGDNDNYVEWFLEASGADVLIRYRYAVAASVTGPVQSWAAKGRCQASARAAALNKIRASMPLQRQAGHCGKKVKAGQDRDCVIRVARKYSSRQDDGPKRGDVRQVAMPLV